MIDDNGFTMNDSFFTFVSHVSFYIGIIFTCVHEI